MAGAGILVLVPHPPEMDPRVEWCIELCRDSGPTTVISADWTGRKQNARSGEEPPTRNVDGRRIGRAVKRSIADPDARPLVIRRILAMRRAARSDPQHLVSTGKLLLALADVMVVLGRIAYDGPVARELYARAKECKEPYRVVVAHDLAALLPAILLRRKAGFRVLYDAHEFWPTANPLHSALERRVIKAIEGPLARRADAVITVTPQIAQLMEQSYAIPRVLFVPNAGPFDDELPEPMPRPDAPVRFLLQGRVTAGRGVENVLEGWRLVRPETRLAIRAPADPFVRWLRTRYADLERTGRVEWLPSVQEHGMVAAAATADVGIIPYGDENPNHRFACPNKLFQYMNAGLALLVNSRSEFVAETVTTAQCGHTFDPSRPNSVAEAVERLAADRETVDELRRHAYGHAKTTFNWQVQSRPYGESLRRLTA